MRNDLAHKNAANFLRLESSQKKIKGYITKLNAMKMWEDMPEFFLILRTVESFKKYEDFLLFLSIFIAADDFDLWEVKTQR